MSEALDQVVSKAVEDSAFRALLLSDPATALAGFQITDDERNLLKGLNAESFDKFAGELGDRTTKGRWIPGAG